MKVALIGLGMVADMHVAALKDAGMHLTCIMGRDPDRVAAFARKHSVAFGTTDIAQVVSHAPDFAIIATPPDIRTDHVTALAEARIPVLMEKPIARNLPEATEIVRICADAGVALGVVLQHRMRPAAQALATRLPALGQIATVDLRVPWWRDQTYYDSPGRGTYARDGGGVLITQAIHQIDLMLQLCGPVKAVTALTASSALHQLEAEDFAAATLRFANGAVGQLMASVTHYPGGPETLTLNCAHGSATLSADHLTVHRQGGAPEVVGTEGNSGGGADPMAFSHAWHQAVIEDFAHSLETGATPTISGQSALPAQALIDAIQDAARSGQRTEVPDV